jgi:hypothetical protein
MWGADILPVSKPPLAQQYCTVSAGPYRRHTHCYLGVRYTTGAKTTPFCPANTLPYVQTHIADIPNYLGVRYALLPKLTQIPVSEVPTPALAQGSDVADK